VWRHAEEVRAFDTHVMLYSGNFQCPVVVFFHIVAEDDEFIAAVSCKEFTEGDELVFLFF